MENLTEERILDALRKVQDPELHRDIVSLGMVKNLAVTNGNVSFTRGAYDAGLSTARNHRQRL